MNNSTILDIKTFTDEELLEEVRYRMTTLSAEDLGYDETPERTVTGYQLMEEMRIDKWREDSRKGHSNVQVDGIWDYVGYPKYTDDYSWCAASLNCTLMLAGYETSESVPTARSFESYGKGVSLTDAKPGDIIVWERNDSNWKGHVAYFVKYENGIIYALGGNQSDQVKVSEYPVRGTFGGSVVYSVSAIRRVTEMNKISEPDWETIKKWNLD